MRITHLSDLHFGHHDEDLAAGLAHDLSSQNPDLVVVSGDFTQLGSRREFMAAHAFLKELTVPFLAVPGNHDVPAYNLFKRFTDPYARYRKFVSDEVEPFVEMEGVAIAGLKTARRVRAGLNWAHGSISKSQLRELRQRFRQADPNSVRVVVAHHPLLWPEEQMMKPMPLVKRADLALRTFGELGVRLVLSGHFHMSYVRRHENPGEVRVAQPSGARRPTAAPILVAQTSSTISTRLRGHANAYNLIDIANGYITVTVREWQDNAWVTRETASEKAVLNHE
ncbi:metallophosphoesterase [Devosia pacifica]|uniref:Metallophosphoesterase n=1 Tax=Devosia pacifica TaxID=1335967 RepID=A0A918SCZ2_9HYPH|nr:metallophosphoesterase [Devosia pacifica]GHA36049.1 metallophosphoesterase [Devosia pacifica]